MLRFLVLGFGCVVFCGAVTLGLLTPAGPAMIGPAVIGALIIVGTTVERFRYKRLQPTRPGPGWRLGGERFVDPETGKIVQVWHKDSTGERLYATSPNGPGTE
jgi:hypothetical protein